MISLMIDLTEEATNLLTPVQGHEILLKKMDVKFIPPGISIKGRKDQVINKCFWRGLLEPKCCRMRNLKVLKVTGFSDEVYRDLALVLLDLAIEPETVIIDGVEAS